MAHKKQNLPRKVCVACKRAFAWRKKWAKVWHEVKYCSDRCRRKKLNMNERTQSHAI